MTRPRRTRLLDVGAHFASEHRRSLGVDRIVGLYQHLARRRLLSRRAVELLVEEMGGRGRAGIVPLREALERFPTEGDAATESALESRTVRLLERSGRHEYRPQAHRSDRRGWIGRVDLARAGGPVIEVNSVAFHADPLAVAADVMRYGRLVESGVGVAVLWEQDVWHEPDAALAAVDLAEHCPFPAVVHSPSMPAAWIPHLGRSCMRIERQAVGASYKNGVGWPIASSA